MLKTSKGFTLIELMIVVVIIALLAGIAIPSYQKHVIETRRSDAKIALTELAQLQESYFADNNEYTNDLRDLGKVKQGGKFLSPEEYYELKIIDATTQTFELEAKAIGIQKDSDDTCQTFTLDAANRKGASGTGSRQRDTSDECWS